MSVEFIYHIVIFAIIFYILSAGFKFFIKLKGTLDFSYFAIIIFSAYLWALLNIHRWIWILWAIALSFVCSVLFTLLVLFLSSKLDEVYFIIWTFTLYILLYQLAMNMDNITGWALGLSGMAQYVIWHFQLQTTTAFFIFSLIRVGAIIISLWYIKKTFFFKVLEWRWENENTIKSLGVRVNVYKFFMILLTTLLATIGGNLYSFYYLYIDPTSFWIWMLVIILIVSFVWYRFNDRGTFLVSLVVIFIYEYLRFFKIVDPNYIGYFREMLFGVFIMISSFLVFKKTYFGRDT